MARRTTFPSASRATKYGYEVRPYTPAAVPWASSAMIPPGHPSSASHDRRWIVGQVRLHARGDGDEVDVLGDRPVRPPLHETRDLGPTVRAPVGDEHHETGPAGGAADRLGRAVEALPVEHRRGGADGRVVGAVARELGERVARHGDGLDLGDPAGRGLVVGVVASELGDGNSAEEDDGDDAR